MLRLQTERLALVVADARLARAMASDRVELGRLLAARVPPEWPPELMDAGAMEFIVRATERDPDAAAWWAWLIVLLPERVLIGSAGFKGPPDADGRVDIGYGVLEPWQLQGYATETVGGLVDWAFRDPRVTRIVGETFPHLPASIRVLEKNGFHFIGTSVGHEGEPEVLQFERKREAAGP
jgi:ribosomal-protein-alanine N-acetyltransferase